MFTSARLVLATVLIAGGLWVGYRAWLGPAGEVHGGTLHVHSITASVAIAGRTVSVWLPPGYDPLRTDGYPVLYVQDGQQLFRPRDDEGMDWQVDETLSPLIEEDSLPPLIVVGLHSTDQRLREYLPTTPFYLQPDSLWRPLRRQQGRPLGDEYMQYLYEDVLPFVHERYHVTSDPSSMFIAGADVGGLFALYAAAKMPFAFGGAAAFAPDWTPGRTATDTAFVTAFRDYWAGQWEALRSARLYVDHPADASGRTFARHRKILGAFLRARNFPRTQWQFRRVDGRAGRAGAPGDRVEAAVRFLLDAPRGPSDQFFVPPALEN